MTTLEQVQRDIEALPQDALDLVAQFIQLIKKSHLASPEAFQAEQLEKGSGAAMIDFLHNHPLSPEHRRTALEIDQQISEERAAWD